MREALRQLEAERLVVITPFKGPAVARIDWAEAEQIYEVRALLEGQGAYLFATRASKEQVAAMRSALKRFEDAVRKNDAEGRLLHTDEFYNVMLKGCGNIVIEDLLTGLHARISFLRARSMSQQGRTRESASELRLNMPRPKKVSPNHNERNRQQGAQAESDDHDDPVECDMRRVPTVLDGACGVEIAFIGEHDRT